MEMQGPVILVITIVMVGLILFAGVFLHSPPTEASPIQQQTFKSEEAFMTRLVGFASDWNWDPKTDTAGQIMLKDLNASPGEDVLAEAGHYRIEGDDIVVISGSEDFSKNMQKHWNAPGMNLIMTFQVRSKFGDDVIESVKILMKENPSAEEE